jgi:hypothetical protein
MSKQDDLLASAKRHAEEASKAQSERRREAESKLADRRWEEAKKAGKR